MLSYTGKAINIKCTEQLFPEFPELLFGRQPEGSVMYFDASAYTKSKGLSSSAVDKFLSSYEAPIDAIVKTLQIPDNEACRINTEGHVLLESSVLYLFLSFIDPRFLLYIIDRMDELFATGVAVSDAYLVRKTRARIPLEVLQQLENDTREQ